MTAATVRRRSLLAAALMAPLVPALAAPRVLVEVWKDPSCGCCKDWVAHLERNGFAVRVTEVAGQAMRRKLGVPDSLGSCHTALVGGYALEGHVPAREIRRLLAEKPQAIGLAVPGMPIGSPGMDGPAYAGRRDPHDVVILLKTGEVRHYASYRA